jgi:hypothetical protein
MDKETERKRVKVFVPMTFEGVTSVAVLEEILQHTDLDIQYTRHVDFRDYHLFKEADVILVLGHGYNGYNLPQEFFTEVDVPFMDFFHVSTYGESIQGTHIKSIVSEDVDPIKELCSYWARFPEATVLAKNITFTEKANHLITAINAYRTWAWQDNNTTRMLLALYNSCHQWLPNLLRGKNFPEVVKQYAPIIKGQLHKMEQYIERKREVTYRTHVTVGEQECLLKVVFADEYINELANALLNEEHTSTPIIVCVGRATKSNDMYSIRTKSVNAGHVANLINEGKGGKKQDKENVATAFSDVGYSELMGRSIHALLQQGL